MPRRLYRMFRLFAVPLAALAIVGVALPAGDAFANGRSGPKKNRGSVVTTTSTTVASSTSTTVASTTSSTTTSSTSTTVAPTTTTTTAPASTTSSSGALSWAPPALTNPITVTLSDSTPYWLATFDDTRDYIVKLPATTALHHGIGITGGHHVLIIGGEIAIPSTSTTSDPEYRVGIKLRNQTGTVHIEGVKITNASDAINMQQQKGATVQLENLYLDTPQPYENSDGSGFHSDLVQTWAGPTNLRIDRLTGRSSFQGLFFDPNDPSFMPHPSPATFDLRNINIDSNGTGSGYNYETVARNTTWTFTGTNIYGTNPTGHIVYTGYGPFPTVNKTKPATDFVPATSVGIGYQSPGYN